MRQVKNTRHIVLVIKGQTKNIKPHALIQTHYGDRKKG